MNNTDVFSKEFIENFSGTFEEYFEICGERMRGVPFMRRDDTFLIFVSKEDGPYVLGGNLAKKKHDISSCATYTTKQE